MESAHIEWYWDLQRGVAVTADERGPGDQMLGPYPSRIEAEHWKDKVEERNEEWTGADDDWNRSGDGQTGRVETSDGQTSDGQTSDGQDR